MTLSVTNAHCPLITSRADGGHGGHWLGSPVDDAQLVHLFNTTTVAEGPMPLKVYSSMHSLDPSVPDGPPAHPVWITGVPSECVEKPSPASW